MRPILFFKLLAIIFFLSSTNAIAENPSSIFDIELGQDVFELSAIEKLGSMYMSFKIAPKKTMPPFDLYSIKADDNYQVQGIYARAKVPSEECESELIKIAHQKEISLGITFKKMVKREESSFMSEDDKSFLAISCGSFRDYRRKEFKDIVMVLYSKEKVVKLVDVDNVKAKKMGNILRKNRAQKTEIKLNSHHDFAGIWSSDCSNSSSGVAIVKLRENIYNFMICSTAKCINAPGISSNDVEIVNNKHLKVTGRDYKYCKALK